MTGAPEDDRDQPSLNRIDFESRKRPTLAPARRRTTSDEEGDSGLSAARQRFLRNRIDPDPSAVASSSERRSADIATQRPVLSHKNGVRPPDSAGLSNPSSEDRTTKRAITLPGVTAFRSGERVSRIRRPLYLGLAAAALIAAIAGWVVAASLDIASPPQKPQAARPAVSPDESYGRRVSAVMRDLTARRRAGRSRLQAARTSRTQSDQAALIADAFRDAERQLSRTPRAGNTTTVQPRLVARLRAIRRGYERLSAAAARRDRDAYNTASREIITEEQRLRRELAGGRRGG